MRNFITLLLLSLLIACSGDKEASCNYVTDYYPKIYEAELNFNQKNYQKSFELYKEAFESCEPRITLKNYEMLKYAEVAAILGEEEIALEFIEKNLDHGILLQSFLQNPVFNEVFKSDQGKKIVANYETDRAESKNPGNDTSRSNVC